MKKYLNIIFIMEEWEIDAGKHLILELSKISNTWSDWIVIQKPIFLVPDFLLKFRIRFVRYLKGMYKIKKIDKNITLFTPKIPFHFLFWLTKKLIANIDLKIMKLQIESLVGKNYADRNIILWVYMPKLFPLTKVLKHDFLIYYIQDNCSYDADSGAVISPDFDINIELIKNSDLVFSTSKSMYEYAVSYNNNVVHLPNGNNFSILSAEDNLCSPTEIDNIDGPIIGYVGGIRCWIDFRLIEYLLEHLEACYVVFIGPLYKNAFKDINTLLKYKNFIWVKFKEQSQLPSYLKKFKVGIIPFKLNKFMDSVFPNKFFEYMARGIPIVTTALPELQDYRDLIGYSLSKEEFINNCQDAVNGKFEKFREQYKYIAGNNTWEHRAMLVNEILRDKLKIN